MSKMNSVSLFRQEGALQNYLTEIYSIPVLTEDEERHYIKLWCEFQDVEAAHKLILAHLRLVVKIALKFKHYGAPLLDLISEGNIGLMKAVQKFNTKFNCKVATYAILWIKATIQDYILKSWSLLKIKTTALKKKLFYNNGELKNKISRVSEGSGQYHAQLLPSNNIDDNGDISEASQNALINGISSFSDELVVDEVDVTDGIETVDVIGGVDMADGVEAVDKVDFDIRDVGTDSKDVDDIGYSNGDALSYGEADAQKLGNILSSEEVMIRDSRNVFSLSSPISKDMDLSFEDVIEDKTQNQEQESISKQDYEIRQKMLWDVIATLSEREKDILMSRKMAEQPVTLDILSERHGVSRERVRQIEENVMKKIKGYFVTQGSGSALSVR